MANKIKDKAKTNGHDEQPDWNKIAEMLGAQETFNNIPDSVPMAQKLGVFQRLMTVPLNDTEARQTLYMAMFRDEKQASLACAAIAHCRRYGATIDPIVNKIAAQCGVQGARVREIILGMNTQNINSNNPQGSLPFWKRKQKESIADMDM